MVQKLAVLLCLVAMVTVDNTSAAAMTTKNGKYHKSKMKYFPAN